MGKACISWSTRLVAAYLVLVSIIILFVHLCHRPLPPNLFCYSIDALYSKKCNNKFTFVFDHHPPSTHHPQHFTFLYLRICVFYIWHTRVSFLMLMITTISMMMIIMVRWISRSTALVAQCCISRHSLCLGKPSKNNSVVFFNIVQKTFGPPPLILNMYVANFF